ncbi:hypothetical protein ABIF66_001122 [Bradyrhizobium japonicum]|jgi:hypothetical protein
MLPDAKSAHAIQALVGKRNNCHCMSLNADRWPDDVRLSDIEPRFATQDAAEAWFVENDPEGVAFEYEVFE